MSLWKKLFGGSEATPATAPEAPEAPATTLPGDPYELLAWIEADANPSGLRCLDCRAIAAQAIAPESVPEQAARFAALRAETGRSFAGARPEDAVPLAAALRMPVPSDETRDGPLFLATALEDKWDVFLREGWLYVRRSWSGQLIYRASLRTEGRFAHVDTVEAPGEAATGDPAFCLAELDFIVKSHLYRLAVPHPLPAELQGDERVLADFSFQRHGRHGLWATYGDTSAYDPWAKAARE